MNIYRAKVYALATVAVAAATAIGALAAIVAIWRSTR